MFEWGVLWKIFEKPLGLISERLLDRFLRWRAQRTMRAASGRKIAILLTKIEGDTAADSYRKTLHETIRREFADAVEIVLWTAALPNLDGHEYDAERGAYATAQKWLAEKHCDFLIAGREKGKNASGETILSLRFVLADIGNREAEPYRLTDTLDLPIKFMTDLGAAIAARVTLSAAPAVEMSGQYLVPLMLIAAERMQPIVARLSPAFDPDTRGAVLQGYALVRSAIGQQTGTNEDLVAAIALLRDALKEHTRERVPLKWAATQNNIGIALWMLGMRESGTARLEEATAAFRNALEELTRERVPLEWTMAKNNLGLVLETLGLRESGTAHLEEAVAAFRETLKELTRERVPLRWAATQNNLGLTLRTLGERKSGTEHLEEAVAAFRDALKESTRQRVPLRWAAMQNNLGGALARLGERESGTERLEEAVRAFRDALKELTRERVPLDWALAQNNLGLALRMLGTRKSGTVHLEEAVAAFRDALKERTRKRVPLQWGATQNNLGNALATLAERESGGERLEEAVAALRAALDVAEAAGAEYYARDWRQDLNRVVVLAERKQKSPPST